MYDPEQKEDPFFLFGLDYSFDIDLNKLDQLYFEFQQKYHPDRNFFKNPQEQRDVQDVSASLNIAYGELKDPILRAKRLLSILTPENPWTENETSVDEDILMQMMVVRETLDMVSSPIEAKRILSDMQHQMDIEIRKMSEAFSSKSSENLRKSIVRALYVRRILNEAERAARKSFDSGNNVVNG